MNQPQDDTPEMAIKHFNDRVRGKVEGQYGPFTNADWQAFCTIERSLREAREQLDQAQRVIVEANNSLFGSQGFFLSVNGGPPNDDHLSRPIESLKGSVRALRQAKEKAEQQLAEAQREIRGIETLRPVWAYGYSSESTATQVTSAALAQVWKALGVTNQTDAMQRLAALREQLAEEVAIVNRIWAIFGTPTYEELQGKTIYDLVQSAQNQSVVMHDMHKALGVKWGDDPYARISTLAADARRYKWLRDKSVPPHNFYLSVPVEFDGVRYTPHEVDAAIDAALEQKS